MTGSTIVIRLRAYRGAQFETTECFNGLRDEAADAIERLTRERDEARARIAAAVEIYAGMEGFIPQTAPEGYQQRIMQQMIAALAAIDAARGRNE